MKRARLALVLALLATGLVWAAPSPTEPDPGPAPSDPSKPASLSEPDYGTKLLQYVFAQKFTKWANYPGLNGRREKYSRLARARDTVVGGKNYQTWATSFYNAPSIAYAKANLFPTKTFNDKILATKKTVQFPEGSVIVKTLYTTNVQPGMHTVPCRVAPPGSPNGFATVNGHLDDSQLIDGKVGLLQIDIGTKQFPNWIWATYQFDPTSHDDTVWRMKELHVQTGFSQMYRGPVDNQASTCMACHQLSQYPPTALLPLATTQLDFHPATQPVQWPDGTTRPGWKLDYIWETTQALQQEALDKAVHDVHLAAATVGGAKDADGIGHAAVGLHEALKKLHDLAAQEEAIRISGDPPTPGVTGAIPH